MDFLPRPTIGDHIEALHAFFMYWTTERGAELDHIVHVVINYLTLALLSGWVLRTFPF